ncbi:hypothetical protein BGZ98_009292 [Dissophora globulifera]|nr:hypothetical protein BGZ98_009292 [Dissophora globulifera]
MAHPAPRKSTSKSPPILPPEFLAPTPPETSLRGAQKSSSTAFGFLKLSGQISQNDERLPQPSPSHQNASESESGGSAPQSVSLPEIPFLDDSPANYGVGHPYTQVASSASSSTPAASQPRQSQPSQSHPSYSSYTRTSQSQSVEVHSQISASGISQSVAAETSFTHHSDHGSHSTSDESGSNRTNNSFGTNSFGTNSSGSMNNNSSDSQASDMSFSNAETSTPRHTPIRQSTTASQRSPSTAESGKSLSPTARIAAAHQRGRAASTPTQNKPFKTIPEHEIVEVLDDEPTQATDAFGTDPSVEEIEAAFHSQPGRADDNATQELPGTDLEDDFPITSIPSSLEILGSTPPSAKSRVRHSRSRISASGESSAADQHYLSSDDDDEASRSTLNKLDLNITQSQSNINISSLLSRSRRASGTLTAVASVPPVAEQNEAPVSSTSNTSDSQHEELLSVSETQDIPETGTAEAHVSSRERSSTPSGSRRSRSPTPPRRRQARRSPRPSTSSSQDLPSSQLSTSHTPSDSFVNLLKSAASQDTSSKPAFTPVPKRQRRKVVETNILQVVSSVGDEEFWEGSRKTTTTTTTIRTTAEEREEHEHHGQPEQLVRSRSGSHDISSFPDDQPLELDFEDIASVPPAARDELTQDPGPSTPRRSAKGSQKVISPSSPKPSPKPRTSQSRELRRRGSSQNEEPSASPRRTLRRLHSSTEGLRMYKANDAVWARWRASYYAGIVGRKTQELYHINFLDNSTTSVEAHHMRPLKLRLGAEVMAKKTDVMDYAAIVEGMQMVLDPTLSRVDVQFEDGTEANLGLHDINLTEAMMSKLDVDMDWDKDRVSHTDTDTDTVQAAPTSLPLIPESSSLNVRQTSLVSASPGTPRKSKGKGRAVALDRSFSGPEPSTPSRRGRNDSLPVFGMSSPSRRGGSPLFKDLHFVLSLSVADQTDLEARIASKIKEHGGTTLPHFGSVIDAGNAAPETLLISFSTRRTPKYLDALALNVPRLSHRWIEDCCEERKLLAYQSYLLPTGFSKELDTIVSSVPLTDRGVFDGLRIGLCGLPNFKNTWTRTLQAAGATAVSVTAKTGPLDCNYVVFSNQAIYDQYVKVQGTGSMLSDEWLIQCLINQRVMPIRGHACYSDFRARSTSTTGGNSSGSSS